MDNNTLDNHLATKDLKQIFSDIQKAGYYNSYMHKKGYIIVKKTKLIKLRIAFDKYGNSPVTIIYPEIVEILFSIFLFLACAALGGIVLVGAIVYIFVRLILFLISLPTSRAFKTEIEHIQLNVN